MFKPFQHDLTIYTGDDFEEVFTYKAGSPEQPVDLTGQRAVLYIKESPVSGNAISLSTENAGIVLGGTSGTIAIRISRTETSSIRIRGGMYSLKLISSDDKVRTFLMGNVKIVRT